jgi:predicted amidohydrolase YtcJ
VGKLADIAVLDWDYFPVPTEEINDIQVNLTIVGEDVVWERALADQEPRTVR